MNIMQSLPFVRQEEDEGGAMTIGYNTHAETMIRLLNEALAAEIICILRYKRHYFRTAGVRPRHVKM